ncbi:hypothetical protein IQ241_11150 [Romeria aff. gracilis LEGE 07310]|uniref:Uncharacterized protein n=1 Tax=Vasconcelosia minhoensis LEGE 07310 TaxID=915328 RepID=A0A8J7ANR0_9CYAN|nr:hypothetical protein [Romeria gracilis]MBE9077844.1 hypothetical protein [Romeria aff. gracilis LEGE 07310]
MQLLSNSPVIGPTSIPLLLRWWQQRKRLAAARYSVQPGTVSADANYLRAYRRLMEIYSVVKAGGVQAQIEASQAFFEREMAALQQVLETLPDPAREHVEQEIRELESATRWRLEQLQKITPQEEAAVQQSLVDIERSLMQLQSA